MSERRLTIIVVADDDLCGLCVQRTGGDMCDIFGELDQLEDDCARHPECLEAEALASKALAVVKAARTASLDDSEEAHRALCVALSDYDSTKGGSDG